VKIATWNVNGARARQAEIQTLTEREQPDVLCLQEIKAAPDQLPVWLLDLDGYWCCWHGGKGYSGVAVLVRRAWCREQPVFGHPTFDFEHRIAYAELPDLTVASLYVPNGGKSFDPKMTFLEAVDTYAAEASAAGRAVILCGDFNVAHTDIDVHPKARKVGVIGQRPEERALFDRLLTRGLVDVNRRLDPDNEDLFTWWAPWRNLRQRNIGWRIDYVLASKSLAARAVSCRAEREVGTSDHGPVIAEFDLS
jgi:exodeoxyribonuclease-3